ncbi:MAG TPA: S8 family peptidase [Urbifossiella sp.]|nr:S8 family peptidase [Urbifossiella sp.]
MRNPLVPAHRVSARVAAQPPLRVERLEDRTVPAAPVFPTDPGFQVLWGLHNTAQTGGQADADIDAPEAWGVTTGSTGVTVAAIDSGVDYTHPDLYLNVWIDQGEIPPAMRPQRLTDGSPDPTRLRDTDADGLITFYDLNAAANAAFVADLNGTGYIDAGDLLGRAGGGPDVRTSWENGLDDDGVGHADDLIGWNYVANTNDPFDDNGHGTHTAGTIGAGWDGSGVVGVSRRTQIMVLKIFGPVGTGTVGEVVADAAAAIRDAADNGSRVSNNSWVFYDGGTGRVPGETVQGTKYPALYAAIQYAGERNHLVVAAAGNDGYDNDANRLRTYPASYDLANIITVAASDKYDKRASFSNYGARTVDLAAPGGTGAAFPQANDNIWSTVPVSRDTDGTPDGYASYRGTSMAAPLVTGTVALMLSVRPDLSAAQIKAAVLGTVDPLTDSSWLTTTKVGGKTVTVHRLGSGGRLNAARALQAAVAAPPGSASAGTTSSSGGPGSTAPDAADGGSAGVAGVAGVASPAAETGSRSAGPALSVPPVSIEPVRTLPARVRAADPEGVRGVYLLLVGGEPAAPVAVARPTGTAAERPDLPAVGRDSVPLALAPDRADGPPHAPAGTEPDGEGGGPDGAEEEWLDGVRV